MVDYVVEISADGFEPALLQVPTGSVIRWINADIKSHSATTTDPALVYPGTVVNNGWDSGLLNVGDAYIFTVGASDVYNYGDRENPLNTGSIIVASSAPDTHTIFLPIVLR